MPRLLRKIRAARWARDEWPPLVLSGDVPADPLADLCTTGNKLSVWAFKEDSDIPRLAAAIAATSHNPKNFDYVQFDSSLIENIGLKMSSSKGGTPDRELNENAHWDLTDLSGQKLIRLALAISDHSEPERVGQKELLKHIVDAIQMGRIPEDRLQEGLTRKIHRVAPKA